MAGDQEKPKKTKKHLTLHQGQGGRAVNKIICFNCRNTIRWYPCPRCKKKPT